MARAQEAVYCTLLMSDAYLPGAMVLAHSLRDRGTKARLVILVTIGYLKPSTVDELQTVYDEIIPINRITNLTPANLYLMERPDLIATFSKIELWRQTQYKQIVYIDADVIALRAPDELLSLDTNFAAVPDIGWPDCFNTGLMVLRPNLQDYYSLLALAQRGISFDGADQGLLNIHFADWKRLSFTYNCTPSGNYQYVPAFRHFESTISLVHYIGQKKPWQLPRTATPVESPYNQLLGRWWATYDRHYRPEVITQMIPHTPARSQEKNPHHATERSTTPRIIPRASVSDTGGMSRKNDIPVESNTNAGVFHTATPASLERKSMTSHSNGRQPPAHSQSSDLQYSSTGTPIVTSASVSTRQELQRQPTEQYQSFETPSFSFAEAAPKSMPSPSPAVPQLKSFVQKSVAQETPQRITSAVPQYVRGEEHVSVYRHTYPDVDSSAAETDVGSQRLSSISSSPALQPQSVENIKPMEAGKSLVIEQEPSVVGTLERPYSPPRFHWDASREPPPADSKPEGLSLPSHSYTMSQDIQFFQPPKRYPEVPKNMHYEVPPKPVLAKPAWVFPWEEKAPAPSRVFPEDNHDEHGALGQPGPPITPETEDRPEEMVSSQRLWQSYVRTNAWDEIPAIERYIRSIQQPRKGSIQVLSGSPSTGRRRSTRITDFPSFEERPSLPVTPAPINGRYKWTTNRGKGTQTDDLPAAEGVPDQADWNPLERLEELRRRSCAFLEIPIRDRVREIPKRDMPEDASPEKGLRGRDGRKLKRPG